MLTANRLSYRDESIGAFIKEVQEDIAKGNTIILGGDFNEPSHLDWQADTKDLWDHNGAVINWDCSIMLQNAEFIDTYRTICPDPVIAPGFTFPAGNRVAEEAKLEKLAWAPEADERDRIDFIYYYPANKAIALQESVLVGPWETIIRGKIEQSFTKDKLFVTKATWPSDHKGNLAVFKINSNK